jgi:hypothetical protein
MLIDGLDGAAVEGVAFVAALVPDFFLPSD